MFKQKTLTLNNMAIGYVDEGNGEPIMLIHGFCGSHAYWNKVIPKLSETHRVIAIDLPGHGISSISEEIHTIDDIADLIKMLLNTLNIDQITLFGHSLGGYITLSFAHKHSQMLKGFSLIHSTAYSDSEEAKKGRTTNIEKVKQDGVKNLIDNLVPKLFSPENLDKNSKELEEAKSIGYQASSDGVITMLAAMRDRADLNQVLKQTSLPVLLVAGDSDQIIPSEKTFSITGSNIQHALIKDAGHMSMYEAPDELISKMMSFMNK